MISEHWKCLASGMDRLVDLYSRNVRGGVRDEVLDALPIYSDSSPQR